MWARQTRAVTPWPQEVPCPLPPSSSLPLMPPPEFLGSQRIPNTCLFSGKGHQFLKRLGLLITGWHSGRHIEFDLIPNLGVL